MSQCETCGNDYNKAFQVTIGGKTTPMTASNVRSTPWLLCAGTAVFGSLGMGLNPPASSIAANIARSTKGSRDSGIASTSRLLNNLHRALAVADRIDVRPLAPSDFPHASGSGHHEKISFGMRMRL